MKEAFEDLMIVKEIKQTVCERIFESFKQHREIFLFSIPYFFCTILLVIFFLICVKVGFLSYFQIRLSKVGFFFGGRTLSFFFPKNGLPH